MRCYVTTKASIQGNERAVNSWRKRDLLLLLLLLLLKNGIRVWVDATLTVSPERYQCELLVSVSNQAPSFLKRCQSWFLVWEQQTIFATNLSSRTIRVTVKLHHWEGRRSATFSCKEIMGTFGIVSQLTSGRQSLLETGTAWRTISTPAFLNHQR